MQSTLDADLKQRVTDASILVPRQAPGEPRFVVIKERGNWLLKIA